MTKELARVGKPTGLSQVEPQSSQGLAPTGFDPSRDGKLNTAGELRGFLADVLTGIRDGTVAVDRAQAIAKVTAQINQSLIVEVNAALQIRKMGEGHPEAGSMLLTSDLPIEAGGGTWCEQCDKRVSREKLKACTSQFCVKVKA